ncbi:hypothetical protein AB0B11_07390 [Micromonospora tulbaghiae]|uniref:hypothetical protein n=1 Tax=Micromonospora tulbaghiae TaxID=479978 RepID=UPI00340E4458
MTGQAVTRLFSPSVVVGHRRPLPLPSAEWMSRTSSCHPIDAIDASGRPIRTTVVASPTVGEGVLRRQPTKLAVAAAIAPTVRLTTTTMAILSAPRSTATPFAGEP